MRKTKGFAQKLRSPASPKNKIAGENTNKKTKRPTLELTRHGKTEGAVVRRGEDQNGSRSHGSHQVDAEGQKAKGATCKVRKVHQSQRQLAGKTEESKSWVYHISLSLQQWMMIVSKRLSLNSDKCSPTVADIGTPRKKN